MILRPETPDDHAAIVLLTQEAFAPMPFADGDEGPAIDALRAAGDLILSLVVEIDGEVVGQITFSPVTFEPPADGWVALGPVAVAPSHQGRGLGRALIDTGLARMREAGYRGVVLIGDPDLYCRFGFQSSGQLTYGKLDTRFVQFAAFTDEVPTGEVHFAPALEEVA